MRVRIYKPAKNAMQSGLAKTGRWLLECETETKRRPEPLMGWSSSGDTLNQIRMFFPTAEKAVAYAQEQGWDYTVYPPKERRVQPRSYMDNFKYEPPEEEKSSK